MNHFQAHALVLLLLALFLPLQLNASAPSPRSSGSSGRRPDVSAESTRTHCQHSSLLPWSKRPTSQGGRHPSHRRPAFLQPRRQIRGGWLYPMKDTDDEKQATDKETKTSQSKETETSSSTFTVEHENVKDYHVVPVICCSHDDDATTTSISLQACHLIPRRQQTPTTTTTTSSSSLTPTVATHEFSAPPRILEFHSDGKPQQQDDNDAMLLQYQLWGWMSDLIVIELSASISTSSSSSSSNNIPEPVIRALRDGLRRRRQNSLDQKEPFVKGNVMILLQQQSPQGAACATTTTTTTTIQSSSTQQHGNNNNDESDETTCHDWRSHLVMDPNLALLLDESLVQEFVILTPQEAHACTLAGVQDLLRPHSDGDDSNNGDKTANTATTTALDLPLAAFPRLLQAMYASLLSENKSSPPQQDHSTTTLILEPDPTLRTLTTESSVSWKRVLHSSGMADLTTLDESNEEEERVSERQQQPPNSSEDEYEDEKEQVVLAWAMDELRSLQVWQEEFWLHMQDDDDFDGNTIQIGNKASNQPLDNFGSLSSAFLEDFFVRHKQIRDETRQRRLVAKVGIELRNLYDQHLQWLRNQYGQEYEQILDQQAAMPHDDETSAESRNSAIEQQLNQAIARITKEFREDAMKAIPSLAQPGGIFRDMDLEYVQVLSQLLQDMQASTELWQLDHSVDDMLLEDDDEQDKPRMAKWYHKLGARALMLAVNYAQGWLAWQGIQRAALERERRFPKFPIF